MTGSTFREKNERQRQLRDRILRPEFYDRYYPNSYEFIEHDDPRAPGGVDTIVTTPDGRTITLDEKIINWPPDRDDWYTAFALETMSCTVPGSERDGWMKTNTVDRLLYCYASKDTAILRAYLIDSPALQEWFWPRQGRYSRSVSDEFNRTEVRVVPIVEVEQAVKTKRYTLVSPPFYNDDGHLIHYCRCGKEAGLGFDVALRHGRLGRWYCVDHAPSDAGSGNA